MDRRQDRIEPDKLLLRYVLAFSLILVFVIGGHALHIITGKQGVLDEEIINTSGRQRMLSQRILLLETRYALTGEERYRALLAEGTDLFEASHDWLIENAVRESGLVQAHYFGDAGPQLDLRTREFIALARQALTASFGSVEAQAISARMEDIALVGLLNDLNTAVSLYETVANTRSRTLETIQWVAVAATVIVLFLEVILIFYPAHRQMAGMIKRLRFQAGHDGMTGLANRARFIARVHEISDAAPAGSDRMLIFALDLDGFKDVNDTLGHPVGDQVLKKVARSIDTILVQDRRFADYVFARVGGDEFLIAGFLPLGDMEAFALDLSKTMIEAVEEPITVTLSEDRVDHCMVGVSIGFALGGQSNGDTEVFLGNADIALYESKRHGKGIATAFRQHMRAAAERRHTLMTELKVGLKNLEFRTHFQPQLCLQTGRLLGVEALARWHHPDRGLVGPADFLDLAEESRLTDALDGQIILGAIEAYRALLLDGVDLGKLSLNASAGVLRDPDFCELLQSMVQMHELSPETVTIEILENVLIKDASDAAIETIQSLSRAGFGVAIDDFGVEYSSLAKVSQLEISAIKIDRSLTTQINDASMRKILQAIAAMAQGLGTTLLAEGIETLEQRDMMRDIGVEIGQGYLWAPPLSPDELRQWVQSRSATQPRLAAGE